jgi:metal-responsive CopG/Arc/MetJ family transcriptional regulator
MPKAGARVLNLNISEDLLDRIEKYRHKRMFATRTEAIEALLEAGLKANPENPTKQKVTPKGE